MRVHVSYTVTFDDDTIAAYCRYNRIDPKTTPRRQIRDMIRGTLEQVGNMGLDEQCHEGSQWLKYDEEG